MLQFSHCFTSSSLLFTETVSFYPLFSPASLMVTMDQVMAGEIHTVFLCHIVYEEMAAGKECSSSIDPLSRKKIIIGYVSNLLGSSRNL
jgi:hypothetical protein